VTLQEALEIVIARTGVARYRWLCSDENPAEHGPTGRETYRRWVISEAEGIPWVDVPAAGRSIVVSGTLPAPSGGGCCGGPDLYDYLI
jgi:hypothetical protein